MRKATDSYTQRMAANAQYVPGSLIVKFRAGTSPAAEPRSSRVIEGRATPALPYAAFDVVALDRSDDPEAVARRLAGTAGRRFAQARYRARPLFKPNDPLYSLQWNYPLLDMERAWDINPGASSSVVVAVLDSGLAYTNIAFNLTQSSPAIDRRRRLSRARHGPSPVCGRLRTSAPAALSLRSISSGTTTSRSTWMVTARTSPARSAS